jgi:hypothetical protein
MASSRYHLPWGIVGQACKTLLISCMGRFVCLQGEEDSGRIYLQTGDQVRLHPHMGFIDYYVLDVPLYDARFYRLPPCV